MHDGSSHDGSGQARHSLEKVHDVLRPGESLLWSGCPRQGFVLRRVDLFLIPVSGLVLLFTVTWEAVALYGTAVSENALIVRLVCSAIGFVFVAFALYLAFGRFLWDRHLRGTTIYVLTSKRALAIGGHHGSSEASTQLSSMNTLSLTPDFGRNTGTIRFYPTSLQDLLQEAMYPTFGHVYARGFHLVPDSKEVLTMLQDASDDSNRERGH